MRSGGSMFCCVALRLPIVLLYFLWLLCGHGFLQQNFIRVLSKRKCLNVAGSSFRTATATHAKYISSAIYLSSRLTLMGSADDDDYSGPGLDMFGDTTDEAILQEMRLERMISNDRWQSVKFRDNFGGCWDGRYEIYKPRIDTMVSDGKPSLMMVESGIIRSTITSSPYTDVGVNITIGEEYDTSFSETDAPVASDAAIVDELLLKPPARSILSTQFRRQCGMQTVGTAFTTCGLHPPVDPYLHEQVDPLSITDDPPTQGFVAEVGIVEKSLRTRVRYVFVRSATYPTVASAALTAEEAQQYDFTLAGFVVFREKFLGVQSSTATIPTGNDGEIFGSSEYGTELYDPQADGTPYVQIPLTGKLTLFFPRGLQLRGRATLAMQWQGSEMKYQVDRKFTQLLGGAMNTLELTEIRVADADVYEPQFVDFPFLR